MFHTKQASASSARWGHWSEKMEGLKARGYGQGVIEGLSGVAQRKSDYPTGAIVVFNRIKPWITSESMMPRILYILANQRNHYSTCIIW